jgi:ribokinase
MGRVVVVGSYNVGLTVIAAALPNIGQTVLGHTFDMGPGGKGSNQAIGAKRLGAEVTLVTKVGTDAFGSEARALFEREGLLGPGILQADTHTGVGLILVDDRGRNLIAVAPGANGLLSVEDARSVPRLFEGASHLLCQLECRPELFDGVAELARAAGVTTILNPAPAIPLGDRTYGLVDFLTPNESELSVLAGVPVTDRAAAAAAARRLLDRGVGRILVTMGDRGVHLISREGEEAFPARSTRAVDTTGAGDAFNAGLAAGLAAGLEIPNAISLGIRAGAFCVSNVGVIAGLPTPEQLDREVPE